MARAIYTCVDAGGTKYKVEGDTQNAVEDIMRACAAKHKTPISDVVDELALARDDEEDDE